MNRLHVEAPDGQDHFEPGTEVDVHLEWDLDHDPETVELRLVWNTAGKGTTDLAVIDTVRFERPLRNESQTATIRLPTSPYSFSGSLISLVWALELVALPKGESTRREIVIAPGAHEISLEPVEAN